MTIASLLSVFNTLVPIFLIVLLGAALRKSGFLDDKFASTLNRFIFWIALPCMIIGTINGSSLSVSFGKTALVLALATISIAAIAWYGAPRLGISAFSRGSFCQTVFRSNNAYIGIPVMSMAYHGLPDHDGVLSLAMLTLAPCLILYNVMAVIVLTEKEQAGSSKFAHFMKLAYGVMHNPLILACVIGCVMLYLDVKLPKGINNTLSLLGNMATSGALVALGASLTRERLMCSVRGANIAAVLKLAVCPLLGLLFASLLKLSPEQRFVTLTYLACPSAVASFVMAEAMHGDSVLAGSAVALTTIYSFISLSLVLLFAFPA